MSGDRRIVDLDGVEVSADGPQWTEDPCVEGETPEERKKRLARNRQRRRRALRNFSLRRIPGLDLPTDVLDILAARFPLIYAAMDNDRELKWAIEQTLEDVADGVTMA